MKSISLICILYIVSFPCASEIAGSEATSSAISLELIGLPIVSIEYKCDGVYSEEQVSSNTVIKKGDAYSRSGIRKSIEGIYSIGDFSNVTCDAQLTEGGVSLTFYMTKKVVVGNITVKGNKSLSYDEITKVLELKPGYEFDNLVAEADVESIGNLYRSRGFFGSDVRLRPKISDTPKQAEVVFEIVSEGQRPIVQKIIFVGTVEAVVRKKNLFPADPEFQSDLDRNEIPAGLFQVFKEQDSLLSSEAAASVEQTGMAWLITDRQHVYSIRKEGDTLNVYSTESLLEIMRKVQLGKAYEGKSALDSDAKIVEENIKKKGYRTARVKEPLALPSNSDTLSQYDGIGKHFAIKSTQVPTPGTNSVFIVIEIEQGRKVYIKFEGDKHIKDEDIVDSISIQKMNSVSAPVLRRSREDIERLYRAKGYYLAKVNYKQSGDEIWNFDTDNEGWEIEAPGAFSSLEVSERMLKMSLSDDISEKVLKTKPLLRSPERRIYTDAYHKIQIRMRTNKGTSCQLYWLTNKSNKWKDNRRYTFSLIPDNQFHDYSIDTELTKVENWSGIVTRLGITPVDVPGADVDIEWIKVITESMVIVFNVDAKRIIRLKREVQIKAEDGTLEMNPDDTRKQILTRKRSFFAFLWPLSRYLPDGVFDEAVFQGDLRAIVAFYKDSGYSNAKVVDVKEETDPEKGKIDITVIVSEGPRTYVKEVVFEGNKEVILDDKDILSNLPSFHKQDVTSEDLSPSRIQYNITSQKIFRADDMALDRSYLRSKYGDKGYLAKIESIKQFSDNNTQATITHLITKGKPIRIDDEIEIRGNTRTKRKVIEQELSDRLVKDKIFSYTEIARSWQRLLDLRYFESVKIDTRLIGDDLARMTIDVEERNPLSVNIHAGLGASRDFGGDVEVRGGVEFAHSNLWGTGQRFGVKAQIGTEGLRGGINYAKPRLLGTGALGLIDIYRDSEREKDYSESRIGGTAGISQRIRRRNTLKYQYRYDVVEYEEAEKDKQITKIGRIETTFQRDGRDNPLNPKTGWFHSIGMEYANTRLGGNETFAKLTIGNIRYFQLSEETVLALGVRTGYGWGLTEEDRVLTPEQFVLKDYSTPRGYDWRREDAGDMMLNLNMEIRFPIYSKYLGGAIFFDSGNVWSGFSNFREEVSDLDFESMKSAVGAGIRFNTPIGPIRLDYGYPLSGGNRRKLPYIALGQAF